MEQLKPEDYLHVQPLFASLDDHLAALAVLAQAAPGEVYVDQAQSPRSVLIKVHHRFYLAGEPDNPSFNRALHELFTQTLYPQAQAAGEEAYVLYPAPGWESAIEMVILQGKAPIQWQRDYYEFELLRTNYRDWLPDGFELRTVDQALLEDSRLTNLDELRQEMCSERASLDEFLQKSFGCAVQHGDDLAGWCLSEYNLGSRCEIGIATDARYQRRGLATLTGAALVERALSLGVNRIGWHCWSANKPSGATALKIGFRKLHSFPAYFATWNEAEQMAIHGDIQLDNGAYAQSLDWLCRAFAQGQVPGWAYTVAACAAARLSDIQAAFDYLNQAIDHQGIKSVERLQANEHLESLHDLPEWGRLLKRLKG